MVLEERIREWQQSLLSKHCTICSDICCNSMKHAILFDDSSLSLFQERGIPVVNGNQLKQPFLPKKGLYLKDGHAVEKPSIVEPPKGIYDKKWFVYADVCPFYTSKRTCDVHEDSRRPRICKNYPIVLLECTDPDGHLLDITVKDSCEYAEKLKREIVKEFPVRIIE